MGKRGKTKTTANGFKATMVRLMPHRRILDTDNLLRGMRISIMASIAKTMRNALARTRVPVSTQCIFNFLHLTTVRLDIL
jgi:hypothetical protein